MLESRVQMSLKTQTAYHRIVMAVDVCVDSVQTLEDLSYRRIKRLREWDAWLGGEDGGIGEEG